MIIILTTSVVASKSLDVVSPVVQFRLKMLNGFDTSLGFLVFEDIGVGVTAVIIDEDDKM
jgi:hypothetical protein